MNLSLIVAVTQILKDFLMHKLVKPSAVVMLAWYNTSRKTINKISIVRKITFS